MWLLSWPSIQNEKGDLLSFGGLIWQKVDQFIAIQDMSDTNYLIGD